MKRLLGLGAVLAALGLSCTPPLTGSTFNPPQPVNQFFPIEVGRTWTYQGIEEGIFVTEIVTVTDQTKAIVQDGVSVNANVVTDNLYKSCAGPTPSPCFYLGERTSDYYATANDGTVWYLGEATAELNRQGHVVSTAGSWVAGVNGARGGVFMPANPQVGQSFKQESAPDAQDFFQIVALDGNNMTTKEWTPLEPGITEFKQYVAGIGLTQDGALSLVAHTP